MAPIFRDGTAQEIIRDGYGVRINITCRPGTSVPLGQSIPLNEPVTIRAGECLSISLTGDNGSVTGHRYSPCDISPTHVAMPGMGLVI